MSRALRVTRGAVATVAATLLAAASHSLAGGAITWLAITATAVLALPLGVALAGRLGSIWRLSFVVLAAQFLFHWSFVGLGTGGALGSGSAGSLHAHLEIAAFAPDTPATADVVMWLGHAVTAVLTIALLHRGEQAFLSLLRLALRALPHELPRATGIAAPTASIPDQPTTTFFDRLITFGSISHRGPPLTA